MNRLRAALPGIAKKYVWNMKYGLLGYPQWVAPDDLVQHLSARLSEKAFVLELGCGRGCLLRALRETGWTGHYCGMDISKRAIGDARRCCDQRSSWIVSEIEVFRSPFKWDAVVMLESIYYIKLAELRVVLAGVVGMLNENGSLVVRVHDVRRHQQYVEAMCHLYPHAQRVAENLFSISHSPRPVNH